ncbi:MAG: chemotaxis protein CheD [Spirochaetes bacterium]|nr:chemotaxis protein CheD [Spirochaetota bacterium]
MSSQTVSIGIAEIKVIKFHGTLKTTLGSCLGVCLYDKKLKIAGMSHIMLPVRRDIESSPTKYADTAIPILIQKMEDNGGSRLNFEAKIFGGSKMFSHHNFEKMSQIGIDNINMVKKILQDENIPIVDEDVGGHTGRTIEFSAETGLVTVSSMNKVIKQI